MGVPFEALIPFAVMLGMFGVTGAGMSLLKRLENDGKRSRWSTDRWDRQMMLRDARLTGHPRGQTDNVDAPAGFEYNNPWRVESRIV